MNLDFLHEISKVAELTYECDRNLSSVSTFKIGGAASVILYPENEAALIDALEICIKRNIRHQIIGNASNILFSDSGFDGAVISTVKMQKISVNQNEIVAECGASLTLLAFRARQASLTGLEFAYGIPGTCGGAVYMNAGAYDGEMRDVVKSVRAYDLHKHDLIEIAGEELKFSYRHSCFMDENFVILSCCFSLKPGDQTEICSKMENLMQRRVSKQPLDLPSAGSIFKRPVGAFAAKLIEDAGLKGYRIGGACVSQKHAGFIVNDGGASAEDVKQLIEAVRDTVLKKFGVELECEIKFIH